jgi:Flp pilus assembly protein CpaB
MKLLQGRRKILVALTMGLILGSFIHAYVSSEDMAPNMVPVVVAGANLTPGTALRPEDLRVVQWPREVLPPHTAVAIPKVTGLVVTVPVNQGEPILLPKLVRPVRREIS